MDSIMDCIGDLDYYASGIPKGIVEYQNLSDSYNRMLDFDYDFFFNQTVEVQHVPVTSSLSISSHPELEIFDFEHSCLLESLTKSELGFLPPDIIAEVFQQLDNNQVQELYNIIDTELIENFSKTFQVIVPKEDSDNKYFLNRNKDYEFTIRYNIPSDFPHSVHLQVKIDSADENDAKCLESCNKNHKGCYNFACNDIGIPLGECFCIELDKQAKEMLIKIKFYCNNTCRSMFLKSLLKFTFCDNKSNKHKEFEFNIKVSERSNRDQCVLQKRLGISIEEPIRIKEEIETEDFLYYSEVKKQLPKLTDLSGQFPGFDVVLGENNKRAFGNEFFGRIDEKISFKILRTPFTEDDSLFIKIMAVDPKNLTKILQCCSKHGRHSIPHVVRSDHQSATYVGNNTGIHMEDRLSIKIPLDDINNDLSCYLLCNNSCFFADKKDTTTALIFTLENAMGQILGRKTFYYKIVERPSRCKFTGNDNKKSNKRKSSDDESSGSESKMSRQYF